MSTSRFEWRCLTCAEKGIQAVEEPTTIGWGRLFRDKSHKGHKRALVDKFTGEIVATGAREALKKGFITKGNKGDNMLGENNLNKESLLAGSPSEKNEDKGETIKEPEPTSDGIFRYTITLPCDAWFLFNVAKALKWEKPDTLFDQWVFDCIVARFSKDYKHQIVVAPIGEEGNG